MGCHAGIPIACSPGTGRTGSTRSSPRSRAPLSSPQQTTDRVRERVIALRRQLVAAGADAGPVSIAWHLGQEGLRAPSVSTIRRILHQAGLITPEPRKARGSQTVTYDATHMRPMTRLMTGWSLGDSNP